MTAAESQTYLSADGGMGPHADVPPAGGPGVYGTRPPVTPAYVHRLVDALLSDTPINFAGAAVPADIQQRLVAAAVPVRPPDLEFVVLGQPAPGGSKNAFIPKTKSGSLARLPDGRPKIVMYDDSKRNKPWRSAVEDAVREQIAPGLPKGKVLDGYPLDCPVEMAVVFTIARPASVRRPHPTVKPDVLKLLRSTEDAVKDAGLLKDDALVWRYRHLAKVYAGSGEYLALDVPGAVIHVWRTPIPARPLRGGRPASADQLTLT